MKSRGQQTQDARTTRVRPFSLMVRTMVECPSRMHAEFTTSAWSTVGTSQERRHVVVEFAGPSEGRIAAANEYSESKLGRQLRIHWGKGKTVPFDTMGASAKKNQRFRGGGETAKHQGNRIVFGCLGAVCPDDVVPFYRRSSLGVGNDDHSRLLDGLLLGIVVPNGIRGGTCFQALKTLGADAALKATGGL